SLLEQDPIKNDKDAAVGVTKIGPGDLWFEGDVDGSGMISVVKYHLDNTGDHCPCLKRSQVVKVDGDPLTAQGTAYQIEVQGVENTSIFAAYNDAVSVGLPIDMTANAIP